MIEYGRVEGIFRECDRSNIKILLSVQENEVKSSMIAITGDNSGDTEKALSKGNDCTRLQIILLL